MRRGEAPRNLLAQEQQPVALRLRAHEVREEPQRLVFQEPNEAGAPEASSLQGTDVLRGADPAIQPAQMAVGQFFGRYDVADARSGDVANPAAAAPQTLEQIALLAANRPGTLAAQPRIEERNALLDDASSERHVAPAGDFSLRERTGLRPEVHRIGHRPLGISRHPGGSAAGIFGDDGASGRIRLGVGVEKRDIGAEEAPDDGLVVVNEDKQRRSRLRNAPIPGMGETLLRLVDHSECSGMTPDKLLETCTCVVRRVVVHHNTLPLRRRQILLRDGFERPNEFGGPIVGGNDERNPNHDAKIAKKSERPTRGRIQ